jgi:hypothetical protein
LQAHVPSGLTWAIAFAITKKLIFNEEVNKSMFSSKLPLFQWLMVSPKEISLLLKWWKKQEVRFP